MKRLAICLWMMTAFLCGLLVTRAAAQKDNSVEQAETEDAERELKTVTLEINAVQIVLNDEHRQGVDWEAIVSDFHTLQLRREDNPIWADKKYKVSVGTVSKEDYAVLLDALDTVGQMTQNPQVPVQLTADRQQTVSMAFLNKVGEVRMSVVWANSEAKGPQLHVEPLIGTVLHETGTPIATTLKAQTDIDLKDDMTIVVGGITSEQEITKTHKFPFLGNLPIVGLVFRSQGRLMQKTETVIFLTPHLKAVQGAGQRAQ